MTRRLLFAAAFALIIFFSFLPVSFAIYQWVDEKGTIHITDYPKPGYRPAEQEQPDTAAPIAPVKKTPSAAEIRSKESRTTEQPAPAAAAPAVQDAKAGKTAGTTTFLPIQQLKQEKASPASKPIPPASSPSIPGAKEELPQAAASASGPPADVAAALVAGFMSVFLFVLIGVYVYFSLCLFLIAKKLEIPTAWMAWIPILQVSPFLRSAGKPLWWFLLFFIPFVNAVVSVYLWMCIAGNLGKNKMLGLLMIIPIANFILMGMLAFSKKEDAMSASPA
jgi:hypothetical protein